MRKLVGLAMLGILSTAGTAFAQGAGDPEKGKTVAKQCTACHNLEQPASKATGPHLIGVVGRKAGSVEDFANKYSSALKESNVVWDAESLDKFLANPQEFIKGSRMAFRLGDAPKRADVIAYLATLKQ